MRCRKCNQDKLRREFYPDDLTKECRHPQLYCMRCVIASSEENGQCPHPSCGQPVPFNSDVVKLIQATLAEMFTEYTAEYTPPCITDSAAHDIIRVSVLTGDSANIIFNPAMTILQLKEQIKSKLEHDVRKQKLLYHDKELQIFGEGGHVMTLSDYSVKPNETIHLVVLLYEIPDAFDHVVFDLYWGYPVHGRDYLDASCLLFNGQNLLSVVDFKQKFTNNPFISILMPLNVKNDAVIHSGDVMDDKQKIGHHTIHVYLKKLPANVTHLFFTLSAWNSPTIARYPNPSLKFYEASNKNKDLCSTTFTHARNSQAVIMCSLSRSSIGWQIFESGKLSAGNARNYDPLKTTIRNLIAEGY